MLREYLNFTGRVRRSEDALDAREKRRDRAQGSARHHVGLCEGERERESVRKGDVAAGCKGWLGALQRGETCHFLGFSNKSARHGVRAVRL